MPLDEGAKFAGFTVVRPLGSGGMGEVYLVNHPRLPRLEALKILPNEISADPEFRERFHREADLAASLWHAHIVGVHDRGECDGQLWMSMDYVEGTDCAQLLSQQNRAGLPRDQAIEIVGAVAGALDYSHERGLLHRDVKPANILISRRTSDRRIALADFGIARRINDISGLTATNAVVGTMAYTSPEQLTGSDIDGRADQYALAATAYQLLCGSPPFKHANPAVVIGHHLTAAPPRIGSVRPDLADLDAALSRALAKQPAARFARCQDFAAALAGSPTGRQDARASTAATLTAPAVAPPPTLVPADSAQNAVAGLAGPPLKPPGGRSTRKAADPVGPVSVRKGSARKRWALALIPIIVALTALAVVGTGVLTRHGTPTKTSQENQVRATIQKFDKAVQTGDLATLRDVTCGTTHDGYMNYDSQAWTEAYNRVAAAKQYPVIASIDKVVVNGQQAEANITTFMAYDPQLRSTRSLGLKFRDDQWKICQP